MIWFIDKFLKFYYVLMLAFTIAAVIAIVDRIHGDELIFNEPLSTGTERNEVSDSVELVGHDVLRGVDYTEFSHYLVKRHKEVIKNGLTINDINLSRKVKFLRQFANTLKKEPVQEKEATQSDNLTQVFDFFYPLVFRLREKILPDEMSLDAKKFSYQVFDLKSLNYYVVRETYIDSSGGSESFCIDWKIYVDPENDGFDSNYKPVKYVKLTATLSTYKLGEQPNYSPEVFPSVREAVNVSNEIVALLVKNNYTDSYELLSKYTAADIVSVIAVTKEHQTSIKKHAPTIENIEVRNTLMQDSYWPARIVYNVNYKDTRFDTDKSVLRLTFLLDKDRNDITIQDVHVEHYMTESDVTLEDLFFSTIILLTIMWGGVMLKVQLGFKDIIKNKYPDIYQNLGKTKLSGHDKWTAYINNNEFKELGDMTLDFYGRHLNFFYSHVRIYLMLLILTISMIKIVN